MSYYFFVGSTMLPIPPEKLSIKISNKNTTVNLINEGEVNLIKTPGLTEIAFDARLPNKYYPFASYDTSLADSMATNILGTSFAFKKAAYFLEKFKELKSGKKPVRLIIMRMSNSYAVLHDTNMLVTLEEYSTEESADDGIDVTCPLVFKQYKPYGTKECQITTDENGVKHITVNSSRVVEDHDTPLAYKIRNEQSILEAVKGVAGGGLDWRAVAISNGITNPGLQNLAGQVLRLG